MATHAETRMLPRHARHRPARHQPLHGPERRKAPIKSTRFHWLLRVMAIVLLASASAALLVAACGYRGGSQAVPAARRGALGQSAHDQKLLRQARAYNAWLEGHPVPSGARADGEGDERYQAALREPGTAVIARIRIPRAGIDLPILHGASSDSLSAGAGHVYGTALPVGGSSLPSVIAAHRGYKAQAMFLHLDRLRPGDKVFVDVAGTTRRYTAIGSRVLDPHDTAWLRSRRPDGLTLLTCTPVGINTQRLAVDARFDRAIGSRTAKEISKNKISK